MENERRREPKEQIQQVVLQSNRKPRRYTLVIPSARKMDGITPRLPRQSGCEISETNTPMLGWVEQMASAETNLAKKMTEIEGDTAIRHQEKKSGSPAIIVTCRRPNLAERQPPMMQAGRPAMR